MFFFSFFFVSLPFGPYNVRMDVTTIFHCKTISLWQASMTGDEGKEVTSSLQYCAVNKSPSGKANMTGNEGK